MTAYRFAAQLVCAFILCASFTDSVADLEAAIGKCNANAASDEDSSQTLISDDCPDLIVEIESSQWGETLAPGWQEEFTYSELAQFEYFVSYYGQRLSERTELSQSSLDAIVLGLNDSADVTNNKSLWDRIVDWFNELLSDKTDYSPGWLSEWFSNVEVSSLAIEIVFWTLSALVVAAAISIIVTEIRAARISSPANELKSKKSSGGAGIGVDNHVLTLKDVDNADLDEKPSLLLRLVLQRLESLGAIAYNPARTHRDVMLATSVLGNDGSEVISRVSESAEQIRFSNEKNQPQETAEVVSAGIKLLGTLQPSQA